MCSQLIRYATIWDGRSNINISQRIPTAINANGPGSRGRPRSIANTNYSVGAIPIACCSSTYAQNTRDSISIIDCFFEFVLIGLMQLGTRCSDSSCQAQEDLIAGFSAIEAEAELIQVCLKLCTATVICAEQERFQIADGFVQPVQVAGFILFRVQLHARQVFIASVAVAFDFCTCHNSFANDLLKCFARDIFNNLHPREQSRAVFRF